VQKVYGYWLCSVGYVCSTSCTEPLTKLTSIWLDNIMDGVSLGDVTSFSLSVIVPCHGHLAKWHSTTVFISGVCFIYSVLEVFLLELTVWFV
jgi:hypothetical protein